MTTKTESKATSAHGLALRRTLADVLAAVERNTALSPTRLRDLRSSVIRVADLLGNVPAGIALDLPTIAARLAAISPVAAGMTPKRFANVRSDFLAAVRASGLMPMRQWHKGRLAPAWRQRGASSLRASRGDGRTSASPASRAMRAPEESTRRRSTMRPSQILLPPFVSNRSTAPRTGCIGR
ncbi:MAG TPA: hypothetical protein VF014_14085 [Casimicrobiaceae bacterium]|nr:hypothetical protein [Casimicrobiaceae bacterium]